nr:DUF3574 domain-containing protein [uncultured Hyphomonas sp.]
MAAADKRKLLSTTYSHALTDEIIHDMAIAEHAIGGRIMTKCVGVFFQSAKLSLTCAGLSLMVACATPAAADPPVGATTNYSDTVCEPLAQAPHETVELYFGLSIANREQDVSKAEWDAFVDEHIVETFPNGFSVADLHGAGYDSDARKIWHEDSKRVTAIVPVSDKTTARVQALTDLYRVRFQQNSVLVNRWDSLASSCHGLAE